MDGRDWPVRMFWKASSTLLASRAEVSIKDRLFSPEHVSLMSDVEKVGQHTCELFCFVRRHSSQVSQVALISNKHDDNIRVSMISKLLQPSCHIVICLVLADVVDKKGAYSTAIISRGNGPITLLSSRIPDLSLDCLCVDLYRPCSELDTDGGL